MESLQHNPPGSDATDTRGAILDAAERLFAAKGFSQASVRAITTDAGTNLASVNYHFGSKLDLIKAVLSRRLEPLNRQRLEHLDALEAAAEPPSLEAILEAFLLPALSLLTDEGQRQTLAKLLGTAFAQPHDEVRQVLLEQFSEVIDRFVNALMLVVPHLQHAEVCWRFHFMVGTLGHTIALGRMVEQYSGGQCDPTDAASIARQLVPFLSAGFRAEPNS